ncbi:hypothetical protein L208DRAFT_1358023 [Tricholoma matsutake]|nr:hypothetical protein L208DRAFT_1358023 [Tricholoma matsutake 945]
MEASLKLLYKVVNPFNCSLTPSNSLPSQTLKSQPDLPLEIWMEIFQLATYVHQQSTIAPLNPFTLRRVSTNVMAVNVPSLSARTKLSLVLVCRSWRRIAIQIFYEYVVIRSPARATALLAVLRSSRAAYDDGGDSQHHNIGYGQWTRHIEVYTHARGTNELQYLQTLFHIFQACPNLHMLSGMWNHPLPVEFLDAISRLYGQSLQGLYWNEVCPIDHPPVATPQFLASFRSLGILDLRNFVGGAISNNPGECFPRPSLPRLQDLIISTYPQSLTLATALSLPALRNLTVKTAVSGEPPLDLLIAFLQVHGPALVSVDIPSPSADSEPEPDTALLRRNLPHINPDIFLQPDICPNLVSFAFPTTSPPLGAHVHRSLRRIGLRGVRAESLYPDKRTSTRGHLMSITPSRYPNLELVRTVGFLVDADTDSLTKDIFIWWAERFEKHGIDFLDGEGVLWAYDSTESECEGPVAVKDSPSTSKHSDNGEKHDDRSNQKQENGKPKGNMLEKP